MMGPRRYWVLLYDHVRDRQIRTYVDPAHDSRDAIAQAETRTGLQAIAAGYAGVSRAPTPKAEADAVGCTCNADDTMEPHANGCAVTRAARSAPSRTTPEGSGSGHVGTN